MTTDDAFLVGATLAVTNRILVSAGQDDTTATNGIIFGLSEDTNLYRSAVNELTTDDSLSVAGTLTVTDSIVTGGSLLLSSDAGTFATGITFGTTGTVNLYRSASDTLRTDDSLSVGGTLTVTDSIVTPGSLLLSSDDGTFDSGIIFGTASTANLYRFQPDTLRTDDNLVIGASLAVANRILVSSAQDSVTATDGIIFGLSEDTNLYRSAVGALTTDTDLTVGGTLIVGDSIVTGGSLLLDSNGGTFDSGIIFGTANTANLYRFQPDTLRTDDNFVIGASLAVANRILVSSAQDSVTATDGIIFGLSEDTNLYRSATNALTTDDSLSVAGTLTVTDSIVTPGSLLLSSDTGTFATGIIFGSTDTVNLFRSAADTLRTDDYFIVGGSLTVTGNTAIAGSLSLRTSGQVLSLGLGAGGFDNTFIFRIPQNSNGSACGTGNAEGLIFQNSDGNQIAHICGDPDGLKADFFAEAFTATATDLAENFSDPNGSLTPGDITVLHPTISVAVVKSSTTYQDLLVGIVATHPGLLLSGITESDGTTSLVNPTPITLAGRVPVNVTNENGPILVGDYITTSSIPGHGMKATKSGRVVGMALENFAGEEGQVLVKVDNFWWDPAESGEVTVTSLAGTVANLTDLTANTATFDRMGASVGTFTRLLATAGEFGTLEATRATFEGLEATTASFSIMQATDGTFDNLMATSAAFDTVEAESGLFTNLEAASATFGELVVDSGTFNQLSATEGLTVGEGVDTTTITRHLSAVKDLNFRVNASSCQDLTILVDGASTAGDTVAVGAPHTLGADLSVTGFVSEPGTVTVRLCNPTEETVDPATESYRVDVWQHE